MAANIFSLKGWEKPAQGNALGSRSKQGTSPERAQQTPPRLIVAPFQGNNTHKVPLTQGVALGCNVWPLRGLEAGERLSPNGF
jgi:hypothetical protein